MKLLSAIVTISSSIFLLVDAQSNNLPLESYFKNNSQKNVAFFAHFGGSSHMNWVLNVVDELGSRGHNAFFITTDKFARYGEPYPRIKTVSIGSTIEVPEGMTVGGGELSAEYPTIFLSKAIQLVNRDLERDYNFTKQFFIDNKIDVAICDNFGDVCVESAKLLEIPFIISCTVDPTDDSAAPYINNKFTTFNEPTTEFQPFLERFKNKFVNPIRDLYYMIPPVTQINKRKAALGIDAKMEDLTAQWKDALKLINTVSGYSPARPLGPLVEFVGPILPKSYTPLTDDLKNYLDKHKRVAYVAFGQEATPTKKETSFILRALLDNVENGTLDGIIWATVTSQDIFADSITTTSGKIFKMQNLLNGRDPHVRIIKWAPQTAVLLHPSTVVFVSHGGLGSWFESMYAGTRMIMFPFFADQPGNAVTVERSNLGAILKTSMHPIEALNLVKKVVDDEDGEIQKSVERFQALTQIHSQHGVVRAADLVEEVAYTHVKGKLPHRESADRRMSYVKGTNLDLYAALAVFLYIGFRTMLFGVKALISLKKSSSQQKIKKL